MGFLHKVILWNLAVVILDMDKSSDLQVEPGEDRASKESHKRQPITALKFL